MTAGMFAAVAAGGALGAMTRYAVSLAVGSGIFGVAGPLATLAVNVAGSAIMGGFAIMGISKGGGMAMSRPPSAGSHATANTVLV